VWIKTVALQCSSPEGTVKGFKKCCISSAMGGTDVNILWNGSADEGSECVDGDSDTGWYR